jgi:V-type H+-transporting ATPase subunit E
MKSRKINECRMAKMKLRHEYIERIQEDIKNALLKKISDPKLYRELLKKLIIQGLIKMLEEKVEIKCLKKDVSLVKELAQQCQR